MATKEEMKEWYAKMDASTLDDAVRVIRRLRLDFPGASRAGVCKALSETAKALAAAPQGEKP